MMIANGFESRNSRRDIPAMIAVSYHLGMRVKEIKKVRLRNLQLLRERYTLEYIASKTGTNAVYLSQIANEVIRKGGKSPRSLSDDYALKIEVGLGLPPGWMDQPHTTSADEEAPAAGAGDVEAGVCRLAGETAFPREPSEDDFAMIPQYTARGSCGNGHLNGHVEVKGGLVFRRDWLSSLGIRPENAAVIYAKGDSMFPTIRCGSVVLLDLARKEPRSGSVYAFAVDDEVRIKRAFKSPNGQWRLVSDSADKIHYPDEPISGATQIEVIGQCMWVGGNL